MAVSHSLIWAADPEAIRELSGENAMLVTVRPGPRSVAVDDITRSDGLPEAATWDAYVMPVCPFLLSLILFGLAV